MMEGWIPPQNAPFADCSACNGQGDLYFVLLLCNTTCVVYQMCIEMIHKSRYTGA